MLLQTASSPLHLSDHLSLGYLAANPVLHASVVI